MRTFSLVAALSLVTVAAPAAADIVIVPASSIQGANVLFNDGTQSGNMVSGATQAGTLVNFTGTTMNGGTVIRANGGQARIEGALDLSTSNPNDTLLLRSLGFGLANGGTFNNLEFNLFNGGGTSGTANFVLTDNAGDVFNFTNLALGSGENFFGFMGIAGQSIANVSFTTTAGVADVRQIRLDESRVTAAVPEPSTWAMMLVGFGAIGFGVRRRRRSGRHLTQIA